jgi:hypothetical protein
MQHRRDATAQYARLAGEYIHDEARRSGTGQWGMAKALADATVRIARAAAASEGMSP